MGENRDGYSGKRKDKVVVCARGIETGGMIDGLSG